MEASNPANFGPKKYCLRECICEVDGQVPCPSFVPLPKEMTGKYRSKMAASQEWETEKKRHPNRVMADESDVWNSTFLLDYSWTSRSHGCHWSDWQERSTNPGQIRSHDVFVWCVFFYFSFIYRFGLFGHVTWFKVHLNIQILKFHHVSCGLCCTWVWSHWCHRVYHVWPRVELHWTKTESVNVCLLNSMTELQLHLQKDNKVMWPV